MPWWCYARADALARFSAGTWELIRKSRLRMAYIGAEAASDDVLERMRKGPASTTPSRWRARCRDNGMIPEFSFVLGGPDDPEGEIEKTLTFIRRLKQLHPDLRDHPVLLQSDAAASTGAALRREPAAAHLPVLQDVRSVGPALPTTPEEWTEPRWVSWVCHQDAPWLTPRIRQRVTDFARVLACRFPTVQDYHTPAWGKALLQSLARWRYATGTIRPPDRAADRAAAAAACAIPRAKACDGIRHGTADSAPSAVSAKPRPQSLA